MIFTRTKRAADRVAEDLDFRGFAVAAVHGDLGQGARERALRAFRAGKIDILVATDVAARGLDVTGVTHVINYDCPEDQDTYTHRIGRTGRAGATGVAVTFVDWEDMPRWRIIDKTLGLDMPEPPETYHTSAHLYTDLRHPGGGAGRAAVGRADPRRAGRRGRGGPRRPVVPGCGRSGVAPTAPGVPAADAVAAARPGRPTTPTPDSPESAADGAEAPRRRRRRRRRGGELVSGPETEPETTAETGGTSEAAGTSDAVAEPGESDAVDTAAGGSGGTARPRRRRRRRRRGGGGTTETAAADPENSSTENSSAED